MNFKQEMINRINKDIERLVAHGKTRIEAINQVRSESCAGPAVWNEILLNEIDIKIKNISSILNID